MSEHPLPRKQYVGKNKVHRKEKKRERRKTSPQKYTYVSVHTHQHIHIRTHTYIHTNTHTYIIIVVEGRELFETMQMTFIIGCVSDEYLTSIC